MLRILGFINGCKLRTLVLVKFFDGEDFFIHIHIIGPIFITTVRYRNLFFSECSENQKYSEARLKCHHRDSQNRHCNRDDTISVNRLRR